MTCTHCKQSIEVGEKFHAMDYGRYYHKRQGTTQGGTPLDCFWAEVKERQSKLSPSKEDHKSTAHAV